MHEPDSPERSVPDEQGQRPDDPSAPETDRIEEDGDPLGANFA